MDDEIWKDIEGYEGLYQASNFGRIKNLHKIRFVGLTKYQRIYPEQIMKQKKLLKGKRYFYINLCKNGVQKLFSVHRIIAKTFIPNPNSLPQVNHKDCDPLKDKGVIQL
jgi:hypothetical protein